MELATNSDSIVSAVQESWRPFTQVFDRPPVRLSIGILEGEGASASPAPPTFRTRDHLLTIISDLDNFVVCDLSAGFGFGCLSPGALSKTSFVRYHFLDAAALALIDQQHLAPVHAALVARNGRGVLLCGDTLAGKSTMAYALARAGWTYISDDGAYLVRGREDRYAIGNSHIIRLRPESKQFFSELEPILTSQRPNGKIALEISTRHLGLATMPGAIVTHVVQLNRFGSCPARLSPVSREETMERVTANDYYGDEKTRRARHREYVRLLDCGLFQLDYSCLASAITRLEELTEI